MRRVYHHFFLGAAALTAALLLGACIGEPRSQAPPNTVLDNTHQFDHQSISGSCAICHEFDRPTRPHEPTLDCSSCHGKGTFWKDIVEFSHIPLPESCTRCHERVRPNSHESVTEMANNDCADCHHPPINGSQGFLFDHRDRNNTNVVVCASCHDHTRPSSVINTFLHSYGGTGDCASCHHSPGITWSGGVFAHNPEKPACSQCHAGNRPAVLINRFLHSYAGMSECTPCHNSPGTTWADGQFNHPPEKPSCTTCHSAPHHSHQDEPSVAYGQCSACHANTGANWNAPYGCGSCH